MLTAVSYGGVRVEFGGGTSSLEARREFFEFVGGRTDGFDESAYAGRLLESVGFSECGFGEGRSRASHAVGCVLCQASSFGDFPSLDGEESVVERGVDGLSAGAGHAGLERDVSSSVSTGVEGSSGVSQETVHSAVGVGGVVGGSTVVQPGGEVGVSSRGKNYVRNRRRRFAKAAKKSSVPEWRRGAAPNGVVSEHRGVFAECSQEVQRELRESRARMLVAKNEAAVVQAKADKQKVEAMVKARVYELDVEARRLKLDKDRKKEITEALAVLPAGYAETIASEGLTSSVPSLSDGSVSPDSSISVAQVNRMEETIKHLTTRVAELTADNTEAEVKLKARIDRLEGELKCSERKVDMVGQQFRGLADERPARKQYVSPFSFV